MTRTEVPRLVVKAISISVLVQVPFIFLLNFGVHSVAGSVGYLFCYAWIRVLESLYRTVGGSWQNSLPVYDVLCVLQTISLSAVVFLLMVFKQRSGSKGASAGRHAV